MRRKYIKPAINAGKFTALSCLLTESYQGEKGGITDDKGKQDDFSVKNNIGDDSTWGNLW